MRIESPVFQNNNKIPSKYTCDGEGINPPLSFFDIPKEAKSLVLIMDDPDIPDIVKQSVGTNVWDHWVLFNMPPNIEKISENTIPKGIVGKNTDKENEYTPCCPPDREHRYFFKLYALDTLLSLDKNATKEDVLNAMEEHIVEGAELIGKYQRK